jgi:hypothetical protein
VEEVAKRLTARGIAYIVHTSYSSGEENKTEGKVRGRGRLDLFLDGTWTPAEHKAICELVNRVSLLNTTSDSIRGAVRGGLAEQRAGRGAGPTDGAANPYPAIDASAVRCTRRFENTHGTGIRELFYRWHPWFGLRVCVHVTIDKAVGIVFRCTLSGSDADRWLEVPAWMFDRAACADKATLSTNPFVDMAALSALGNLLADVLKAPPPSSNVPLSGASWASREQNRGEAHVREDSICRAAAQQSRTKYGRRRKPVHTEYSIRAGMREKIK